MRSSKRALVIISLLALLMVFSSAAEEKRLSIYTPQNTYTTNVLDRNGREYVSLADVLGRFGTTVSSGTDAAWKVRFRKVESQFSSGQTKARVAGKDVTLSAAALVEGDTLLVPVSSLPVLLARYGESKVELRETGRRLFVGISPLQLSAELQKQEPPALVLNFTQPVNPSINSEPGQVRLVFGREPVVGEESLRFDDRVITNASFREVNGQGELTVLSSAPLLATFSNGNKTITLTAAPPQQAKQEPEAPSPATTASPSASPTVTTEFPASPSGTGLPTATPRPRFLVVIDPSHGGTETGARLNDELEEKEITLAIAKRVRAELQTRGVNVMLLRDGDTTLPLEQRAELVNTSRAAVYVAIHAGGMGYNTNLFTALLSPRAPEAKPTSFLPWESAQAEHLNASRLVAEGVSSELQKRQVPVLMTPAPLRPLNNIAAAAIGVEVCSSTGDPAGLTNSAYQQRVALAIAEGIAALRENPEVRR